MTATPKKPSSPVSKAPGWGAYAGLHLSGANATKTALVVLAGHSFEEPLKLRKVYEKIGSFGSLFSDERLLEILVHEGPFAEVFVDCPLTVPPCVACQREVCPGAVKCDDVSVAYMLSVSSKIRRKGARKARPINPQSQRLWDVLQLAQPQDDARERLEPSYSANLAPLVVRATTLQRRLNSLDPRIVLKETHVGNALSELSVGLGMDRGLSRAYRSFENGQKMRLACVRRMIDKGWLAPATPAGEQVLDLPIVRSVETFNAFVAAVVAALHHAGLTERRPEHFLPDEGWVHLPRFAESSLIPTPISES